MKFVIILANEATRGHERVREPPKTDRARVRSVCPFLVSVRDDPYMRKTPQKIQSMENIILGKMYSCVEAATHSDTDRRATTAVHNS